MPWSKKYFDDKKVSKQFTSVSLSAIDLDLFARSRDVLLKRLNMFLLGFWSFFHYSTFIFRDNGFG